MATDFNINNLLGGGSAATFGNFGDTSTPADLFTPTPPSDPADLFNFENSYLNSNQLYRFDPSPNAPGAGFAGGGFGYDYRDTVQELESSRALDSVVGDTLSAIQQYGGGFGSNFFGSPSFTAIDKAIGTAQRAASNTYDTNLINAGLRNPALTDPAYAYRSTYTKGLDDLLERMRTANQDLVDFSARTFDPVVSSTPGPGLEPFSRFNPTTQQFEQFFGNPAARLPSADVFVKGETGFNDGARFLQSIRDEAQRNATNFLGQPVTNEQLAQAEELGALMGTTPKFTADSNQVLQTADYGQASAPVSAEDLNKLLNMRKSQQAQANNQRREEFMKTDPTFLGAMADMNKAQAESRAAYDRASALQQQALENRVPFGATFNYDDQGNRVLAGADARAAAATATGQQPMTFEEARKFVARRPGEPVRNYNDRIRSFMAQSNQMMEEEGKAVVEEVATFKNAMGSIGVTMERLGFDDAAIAAGVKSAGSGINFARQMASILKDMPDPQTAEEFTTSTNETLNEVSIKTPKQYMIKETGEITTLGFGPGGSLARVFPPKFDERGNMISNRRIEEFGNDEVQLYETGDFRADQETLNTLEAEITGADTQALDKLIDFRDLRAQSAQGLKKLITDIGRTYKTIMQKGLTEAEMIEAVTSAKFEGLLGTVRLEVLGPGVLTEQDAVRLIKAMGGFGFTANRKAAVRILDDIIESKEKILRAKINQYNDYRTSNLALRNLKDTEGNTRFPEIKFESRLKPPPLVP